MAPTTQLILLYPYALRTRKSAGLMTGDSNPCFRRERAKLLGFLRPRLLNPARSQIHKTTLKPATYMQSVFGGLLRMPNKQLKSRNYLSTRLLKSLPCGER
jgi:hypothetical protein